MAINTKIINEDGSVSLFDGYVSTWNEVTQQYEGRPPPAGGAPTGPAGGDLGTSYPNPTVVDLTIASEQQGSLLYFNGTNWVQLSPNDDGYILTTHSTGANPTWEPPGSSVPAGAAGGDLSGTYPNPTVSDLTITSEEQGSILYFNGTNWVQLAPGTAGRFLRTDGTGTDPVWAVNSPTGAAGGDLSGTYPNPTVSDLTIASEEQGSILYFDGSNWVQLAPGADGYTLTTHGTSANPTWGSELLDHLSNTSNPHNTSIGNISSGTLSQLNSAIIDATLDTNTDSRPPNGPAGGDLSGTYPNPTVSDLTIASEATGSMLYFNGTNWINLAAGADGKYLSLVSGIPAWSENIGSSSFVEIIYQPGGIQVGNVYTDLDDASARIASIVSAGGNGVIYLDGYKNSNTITFLTELYLLDHFHCRIINCDVVDTSIGGIYDARSVICDRMVRWIVTDNFFARPIHFTLPTITAPVRLENIYFESNRNSGFQRRCIQLSYPMSLELVNVKYDFQLIETDTIDSGKTICLNLINTPIRPKIIRDFSWTSSHLQIFTDGPVGDVPDDWTGGNTYNIVYTNNSAPRGNLGVLNGPIGLWNFENSGIDYANQLDLTFSSTPIYVPGHAWNSFAFQGGSVYATQADSVFRMTGTWTIEMIVFISAYPGANLTLIDQRGPTTAESDNALYAIYITSTGDLRLYTEHDAGIGTTSVGAGNGAIPVNQWCHIAVTKNATTGVKFYVNGRLLSSPTLAFAPTGGSTSSLTIGGGYGGTSLFAGRISSVKMDNTEYTQTQISKDVEESLGFKNSLNISNRNISTGITTRKGLTASSIVVDLEEAQSLHYTVNTAGTITVKPPAQSGSIILYLDNPSTYNITFNANLDGLGNAGTYPAGGASPTLSTSTVVLEIFYFVLDNSTYEYVVNVI